MNSHTKLHSNMYAQPSVMHPSFCATAVFALLIGISAMIVFTLMRAAGALSPSLSVTRNISRRSNKRTRHSQLLSRLTTARQDEVKTLSATLNRSGLQLSQVATGILSFQFALRTSMSSSRGGVPSRLLALASTWVPDVDTVAPDVAVHIMQVCAAMSRNAKPLNPYEYWPTVSPRCCCWAEVSILSCCCFLSPAPI